MMVVLLGFAAISIDVGKIYWEKAQLQNGADAGALALAVNLRQGHQPTRCVVPVLEIAQDLANANSNDNQSISHSVEIRSNEVTVKTSASEVGAPANSVSIWFAKILDPSFASVEVGARATAGWGLAVGPHCQVPSRFFKVRD